MQPGELQVDLQLVYNIVLALTAFVAAIGGVVAAIQGRKNADAIAQVHTIVNGNNSALQTKVTAQAEIIGQQKEQIKNVQASS